MTDSKPSKSPARARDSIAIARQQNTPNSLVKKRASIGIAEMSGKRRVTFGLALRYVFYYVYVDTKIPFLFLVRRYLTIGDLQRPQYEKVRHRYDVMVAVDQL